MRNRNKNTLNGIGWLIILCLLIFALAKSAGAQKLTNDSFSVIEFSLATEDAAPGLTYSKVWNGIGVLTGFESGNYKYGEYSKISHQKYKIGVLGNFDKLSYSGSFNFSISCCYNDYHVKRNVLNKIDTNNLKRITAEVGVKFCFPYDFVVAGFNYDPIHRTGGFSVGIRFNNK